MAGIFKAYDIRGRFGRDFSSETFYTIGRLLPTIVPAHRVAVGRDARVSSPALCDALCRGLSHAGCSVDDLGLATTPMVYYAAGAQGYDLALQITASHNPPEYNGLKVSRKGGVPVGYDTGLRELESLMNHPLPPPVAAPPALNRRELLETYLEFLSAWRPNLAGLRLAMDCSNGMAALVARRLFGDGIEYLYDQVDGTFPHHSPNPMEVESRRSLADSVTRHGLDVGVIFDGDADRVMFVDEHGEFVRPDLMIPIVAAPFLRAHPGATVLCDIRTSRGVTEALLHAGARVEIWKVGHAFAKVRMRELDAVCGGELAGHYYFRDFFNCDSGELAAMIALDELAAARRSGRNFDSLLAPMLAVANSGELNYRVDRKQEAMDLVRDALVREAAPTTLLDFDGYRIEYPDWWVSIRASNTESYLRLILEADDPELLRRKRGEIEQRLQPFFTDGRS